MGRLGNGFRWLAAAVAGAGVLLAHVAQSARADTFVGTIYQDSKQASCAQRISCPITFKSVDFNLRVVSLSCRITLTVGTGPSYPDRIDGVWLKQTGGSEKVYVGHVPIIRYTESVVVYQVFISQVNFGILSGRRPVIEISFSDASSDFAPADCSIAGEVMPGA